MFLMCRGSNNFRLLVVVTSMLAWLAASNHCVLAAKPAAVHEAASSESECPMHAQKQHAPLPEKGNGCGDLPCCKRLQATVVSPGKAVAKPVWLGALQPFFTPAFRLVDAQSGRLSPILDTGPPGKSSFAELVLQRSLLAHAPPASLS
jgi:hypothetical protein